MRRAILLMLLALLLAACARESRETLPGQAPSERTPPAERQRQQDGPPSEAFDPARIQPIHPRPEPRSPYGNHSPYQVFGVTYHVKDSADGYVEQGIASWYGTKFHGRATSSGEPYDMHQLTAAHRSLPLPTYAEVRHLENGRSIIVRINDRGPFHPDRIIDLSWAAAVKLGIDQAGTGPVEVRAITFDEPPRLAHSPARVPVSLQVAAFGDRARADALKNQLQASGVGPLKTERARTANGTIWRVQVGPLDAAERAMDLVEQIYDLGFGKPRYVYP
ncbi:MAG: septal ring lytic transglycosylase RlpA family protein [Wenzhouxiangella sp.]